MKKIILLLSAALLSASILCGCAQKAGNEVKDAASKVESGAKEIFGTEASEPYGAEEESVLSTDNTEPTELEAIIGEIETRWQDMVDDGTVEDGDGNVGEAENNDGDSADPDDAE